MIRFERCPGRSQDFSTGNSSHAGMYGSSVLLRCSFSWLLLSMGCLPDMLTFQQKDESRGWVECQWYSSGLKAHVKIWPQQKGKGRRTEEHSVACGTPVESLNEADVSQRPNPFWWPTSARSSCHFKINCCWGWPCVDSLKVTMGWWWIIPHGRPKDGSGCSFLGSPKSALAKNNLHLLNKIDLYKRNDSY